MNESIRAYVERLFEDAPKTRKAHDLKEELIANLSARYDDLIAQGKEGDEAYRVTVEGIGNVDELLGALHHDDVFGGERSDRDRRRSAGIVSVAIMLYILSVVPVLIFHGTEGVVSMFVICAVATGMLIYNAMSRPKYVRADDTIVEEFKEWKSASTQDRRVRKSISAALWPLVVVVYILVSFQFGAWAYSWVIFLVGVAVDRIITLLLDLRK